jgi:hypothetical protein
MDRSRIRAADVWVGFVCGLFGYLLAGCGFAEEGLFTGGAGPGDQLAAGLAVAIAIGAVATVAVVMAGIRAGTRSPGRAVGLAVGGVVGVLVLVRLIVLVATVLSGLTGHCPCEPLIRQLHDGGD